MNQKIILNTLLHITIADLNSKIYNLKKYSGYHKNIGRIYKKSPRIIGIEFYNSAFGEHCCIKFEYKEKIIRIISRVDGDLITIESSSSISNSNFITTLYSSTRPMYINRKFLALEELLKL